MAETTAEPRQPGAPAGVRLSARARILAWLLVLMAVFGAGALVLARQILVYRAEREVTAALEQEYAEFSRLVARGRDPATGRPFRSVDALLSTFIGRQYPADGEVLITLVDGAEREFTPSGARSRALLAPQFVDRYAAATDRVGYGELRVPTGERIRYVSVPVTVDGDPRLGHLVVAVDLSARLTEVNDVVRVLVAVSAGALLLAGIAGWLVAGAVLAPVRLVRQTARLISETDLTQRIPVSGSDDIADLARTFNAMLDRLEQAFSVQRRFLDDAGHELRTPITIVRGHLELMGDDPDDRRETLALVDDELERMNRIVDDLLVLAKAERPDFLALADVDLAGLVSDIVAKARMIAPREWVLVGAPEGSAVIDPQRISQAMLQLAQNATQHTGDGDRIEVGAAVVPERGELLLWVRDTGSGVAEQDAERIFRRFARGGSGPRRSEGAGLGLPIVKAIAEAHGGRVTLHSRPGEGATFRLELPYRPGRVAGAETATTGGSIR